jgi:hypothetical protein
MDRKNSHPGDGRTLPVELYLLACDAEKERLTKRDVIGNVLRAAVLIELTERGCLAEDDGKVRTVGDRRTGDPLLDEPLKLMAADKQRKWKALVQRERRNTLKAVEARVEKDRLVGFERRTWLPDKVFVKNTAALRDMHAEVHETLTGERPVKEFTTRQAAVAALAAIGEFPTVASGKERRHNKKRIKELTERAGEAAPALKKALEEIQVATMAAIAAASSAGASGT